MNYLNDSVFENLKPHIDEDFLNKFITHYKQILYWFDKHNTYVKQLNSYSLYKNNDTNSKSNDSINSNYCNDQDGEDVEQYNNENIEMQLTPEMAEFLKKSAEHRKVRDNEKKIVNSIDDMHKFGKTYQDLTTVTSYQPTPTTESPRFRPNHMRFLDMQRLYGNEGSVKIIAMETAIQLSFDRNKDRHQAKHWPALPINIQFA